MSNAFKVIIYLFNIIPQRNPIFITLTSLGDKTYIESKTDLFPLVSRMLVNNALQLVNLILLSEQCLLDWSIG